MLQAVYISEMVRYSAFNSILSEISLICEFKVKFLINSINAYNLSNPRRLTKFCGIFPVNWLKLKSLKCLVLINAKYGLTTFMSRRFCKVSSCGGIWPTNWLDERSLSKNSNYHRDHHVNNNLQYFEVCHGRKRWRNNSGKKISAKAPKNVKLINCRV